jgi:peptidyl-prolyl cis-trans isomerase C
MKTLSSMLACAFLGAGVAVVAAGCSHDDGAVHAVPGAVVETVNGEPVPRALLEALARGRKLDLARADQYARALDELTEYVVLAQEARRQDYASDADFAAGVELNRLQGIANATLAKFQSSASIDDATLQAAYRDQIARTGNVAYDFSQLIFATEKEALAAEAELLSGTAFRDLMQEHAHDARSARSFLAVRRDQVPDALGDALASLAAGESGKVPVQTQFGWHVVHVDATHAYTPPSFDTLEAGIRRAETGKLAEARLTRLKEAATIDVVQTPPAGTAEHAKQPDAAGHDARADGQDPNHS